MVQVMGANLLQAAVQHRLQTGSAAPCAIAGIWAEARHKAGAWCLAAQLGLRCGRAGRCCEASKGRPLGGVIRHWGRVGGRGGGRKAAGSGWQLLCCQALRA